MRGSVSPAIGEPPTRCSSSSKRSRSMPIIVPSKSVVTQINVFTVPSGQQQPLLDFLAKAAQVAKEVPGWISASLHRSLDGTRVVNYAQSESLEASQRVL